MTATVPNRKSESGSPVSKANDFLASKMALTLSSMWMFWLLTIILLIAFVMQPPKGAYQMVIFVVGATFQALALPVLAFVSNLQGDRQEALLNEMQDELMQEIDILKQLIAEQSSDTPTSTSVGNQAD